MILFVLCNNLTLFKKNLKLYIIFLYFTHCHVFVLAAAAVSVSVALKLSSSAASFRGENTTWYIKPAKNVQ